MGGKVGDNEIAHFVATFVECCFVGFGGGRVEGEEEHAACGAEFFFVACGMPIVAKTFRAEEDKAAARFEDLVSAGFFAWTHKCGDAGTARAEAFGLQEGMLPFGAVFLPTARTLEGIQDGMFEEGCISIGIPLVSKKGDFSHVLEEAWVCHSEVAAFGIFADVTSEGGELFGLFDDPVMPGFDEERFGEGGVCGCQCFSQQSIKGAD